MRIRMKETRRGADDGHTVREYLAGREYDLSGTPRAEDLAQVFVREGWADEVKAPPAAEPARKPEPPAAPPAPTAPPAPPPAPTAAPVAPPPAASSPPADRPPPATRKNR